MLPLFLQVTEGLLLYISLQINHLSRSSVKELNPQLKLWIGQSTGKGSRGESSKSEELPQEFQVQSTSINIVMYWECGENSIIFHQHYNSCNVVLASGLGCYFLDGTLFLNTLCE